MTGTGSFENWPADPSSLGPLYPFGGYELLMTICCLLSFVGFFVWKLYLERHKYEAERTVLRVEEAPARIER